MKTIQMICPKCEGEGKIELPEHLSETLGCFITSRGAKTTEEIAAKLGIDRGAANNRLVDLLILKLLTRKRTGKWWQYSRASSPPSAAPNQPRP